MVQRIIRPLWFPVLFGCMLWSLFYATESLWPVGESSASAADDSTLSIGGFIKDTVDPRVLAIAALCLLLFGRLKGTVAGMKFLVGSLGSERVPVVDIDRADSFLRAGQALGALGRGLLWGSVLLNAYYLSRLPWTAELVSTRWFDWGQLMYVRVGGLTILALTALYLLPLARHARFIGQSASGTTPFRGSPILEGLDRLAALGLLGLALLLTLTEFKYRVIEGPARNVSDYTILKPVYDGVDSTLLLYSLLFVALFTAVAFLPTLRRFQGGSLWRALANLAFMCGVLGAFVVLAAGYTHIAKSGGQANSVELQVATGRALVPLAVGIVIFLAARILARLRARSI